jgi:hypothetical protein
VQGLGIIQGVKSGLEPGTFTAVATAGNQFFKMLVPINKVHDIESQKTRVSEQSKLTSGNMLPFNLESEG